jgi:V/A-type H+/Na+-transporting ATPase subunit K
MFVVLVLPATLAAGEDPGKLTDASSMSSAYRTIGLGWAAALTMAVCVLGAGYAVARIGAAAMGAAAEKPELLTRSLLFVALAEGLAVLGFAIAMMILQKA